MVNISPEAWKAFSSVIVGLTLQQLPSLTAAEKKSVVQAFVIIMRTNSFEHLGHLKDAKLESMEKEYVKAAIFLRARLKGLQPATGSAATIRVSDSLSISPTQQDSLSQFEFLGTDDKTAEEGKTCPVTLSLHVDAIRHGCRNYNTLVADRASTLLEFKKEMVLLLLALGERIRQERATVSIETSQKNAEEAKLRMQQHDMLTGEGLARDAKLQRKEDKKRKREEAAAVAAAEDGGGNEAAAAAEDGGEDDSVQIVPASESSKNPKKKKKNKSKTMVSPDPNMQAGMTADDLFGTGGGSSSSTIDLTEDDMLGLIVKAIDSATSKQSPTKSSFQVTKTRDFLHFFPDLDALVVAGHITMAIKDKLDAEDVDMEFLVRVFLGQKAPNGHTAFTESLSGANIRAGTADKVYKGLTGAYQTL